MIGFGVHVVPILLSADSLAQRAFLGSGPHHKGTLIVCESFGIVVCRICCHQTIVMSRGLRCNVGASKYNFSALQLLITACCQSHLELSIVRTLRHIQLI